MITSFLHNARLLTTTFGIIPLLYGSLGLEYRTEEPLQADDIDILIPETFLTDRWPEFISILTQNGYTLTDEHEHTFEKDGLHYSYASLEELETFAGISADAIPMLREDGIIFRLLTLEQYLAVYTVSVKDGYRIDVRGKKDAEKIALIRKKLKMLARPMDKTDP
ncbi:MAG: phosphoribosylanthranilate isomerase [Ruminococcaceae bacterium]|nr:phosphoribosylanthranilate isomerase [Oscillospiraceae bacterium]